MGVNKVKRDHRIIVNQSLFKEAHKFLELHTIGILVQPKTQNNVIIMSCIMIKGLTILNSY